MKIDRVCTTIILDIIDAIYVPSKLPHWTVDSMLNVTGMQLELFAIVIVHMQKKTANIVSLNCLKLFKYLILIFIVYY